MILDKIIEIEWEMFRTVNGDDRVDCQDNRKTFEGMRKAQYSLWSEEALASYLEDITTAKNNGYSLLREKYIRMMKNISPENYALLKPTLPNVSDEKIDLVNDIWAIMYEQTERMRVKYPHVALQGRPLLTSEETTWASVETYQKAELTTFSEKTLSLLLKRIKELQAEGKDYAYMVQENTITALGFKNMDDAEENLARAQSNPA